MALTDITIRNAKAADKPYKLADAHGLYLYVSKSGSKLWRYDYAFGGKRKTLSLGQYPEMSLADARAARDDVKRIIASGIDPIVQRRLDQIAEESSKANTFEVIVDEYLERFEKKDPPPAPATLNKTRWILKDLVCPDLGKRPISEITSAEVLSVLRRLEKQGKRETARRARSTISAVFRYAITTLRAVNDPTSVLRDALLPPKVVSRAAIVEEAPFGALIASIQEYDGWPSLKNALLFTAYTFCRPGEVRYATWNEFDLKGKFWEIPAERMKMRREHRVPLSRQALALLEEMKEIDSRSKLVFPSLRSNVKPLSENAMNSALRRMGFTKEEATAHGFRSSASTILNRRGFDPEVIEIQLAHMDKDRIRRIYNRNTYWDQRVELMQKWANIVDSLALM